MATLSIGVGQQPKTRPGMCYFAVQKDTLPTSYVALEERGGKIDNGAMMKAMASAAGVED